ncbi:hypothetical protein Dvina_47015 [Dactylosporangium vinaceum]|uniref:Uncharacterized protein n=1 Tax=Dactylosporangium vinaceum TaxID=53362 RepID=A0ABV5MLD7_9ACTN|nr:hypothetical protein [Dactylosporangium vinaceum]UAB95491.1 hypothetical protein Dvina_47015 [Dactylosporangium vinaceum]
MTASDSGALCDTATGAAWTAVLRAATGCTVGSVATGWGCAGGGGGGTGRFCPAFAEAALSIAWSASTVVTTGAGAPVAGAVIAAASAVGCELPAACGGSVARLGRDRELRGLPAAS